MGLLGNVVARFDGLVNALSGIGTARDKGASIHTRVTNARVLGWQELDELYDSNYIAAKIVDEPADEANRRGYRVVVTDENDGETQPFDADLERLGIVSKYQESDRWSRKDGGAGTVLGVNDGKAMSEPVDLKSVESIDYALVVDRYELTVDTVFDSLADADRLGEPKTYRFTPHSLDVQSIKGADGETQSLETIHADRFVRFDGAPLPRRKRIMNDYWHRSYLQRTFDAVTRFGMVEAGAANAVHEYNIALFEIEGLFDMVTGGKTDLLMERLAAVNLSKSVCNAVALDAGREKFEFLTRDVRGLGDLWDRFAMAMSAASGIPLTILFGQAPKGLSTDDESGRRAWYDRIRARQKKTYEPAIRRVIDLLIAAKDGPVDGDIEYKVEFAPLEDPNESEIAATRKNQSDADATYINEGVFTEDEVRNARAGAESGIERTDEGDVALAEATAVPPEPAPAATP